MPSKCSNNRATKPMKLREQLIELCRNNRLNFYHSTESSKLVLYQTMKERKYNTHLNEKFPIIKNANVQESKKIRYFIDGKTLITRFLHGVKYILMIRGTRTIEKKGLQFSYICRNLTCRTIFKLFYKPYKINSFIWLSKQTKLL